MFDLEVVTLITLIFLFAGFVKGVSGIGLPAVSLSFLTMIMGLKFAVALVVMPGLLTNVWQAFGKTKIIFIMYRMWPLLLAMFCFSILGASLLAQYSESLTILLGFLLIVYGLISVLLNRQYFVPKKYEKSVGFISGALGGFFGGSTGTFVFPIALYVYSLKMSKEEFLQSIALVLISASFCLGFSLMVTRLWSFNLAFYSFYAVFPSFIGMYIGRKIQTNLEERIFRTIFLIMIIIVGLLIILRSFG
tara:strand:- start:1937 stop:2680 length:744 start_codon:yes stop_codon:yes gene_type:complete